MPDLIWSHPLTASIRPRVAEFWMTDASDPNLTPRQDSASLHSAQQSVRAGSWSWVRQVHSDRVVIASAPGDGAGATGDAIVTNVPDAVVAIQVADCVPIGLTSTHGAIGVVHAGWRGALDGVIESAVRTLRAAAPSGAGPAIDAVVGPHICVDCYEFGADDLATMTRRFGAGVEGVTSTGTPGLNMTAVVTAELQRLGIDPDLSPVNCTACSGRYWSHRARAESQRQSLVAVITESATP